VARRGSAAVYYRSSVSVYRELDLCQHRDSIERVLCPGPVYQEVNARKSRARRLRPGGDPQEVRAGRGALGERSAGHDQLIKALFRTVNLSHPSQEVSCAKIETSARGGARAAWPGAKRSQRKASVFPAWQAMHVSQVSPSLLALSPCSVFSPITFHMLQQCRIVVTVVFGDLTDCSVSSSQ
jgi:hypothetical protein